MGRKSVWWVVWRLYCCCWWCCCLLTNTFPIVIERHAPCGDCLKGIWECNVFLHFDAVCKSIFRVIRLLVCLFYFFYGNQTTQNERMIEQQRKCLLLKQIATVISTSYCSETFSFSYCFIYIYIFLFPPVPYTTQQLRSYY